jgi:hypothetical protein
VKDNLGEKKVKGRGFWRVKKMKGIPQGVVSGSGSLYRE